MTERWSYLCVVPPFFIEGGLYQGGGFFGQVGQVRRVGRFHLIFLATFSIN